MHNLKILPVILLFLTAFVSGCTRPGNGTMEYPIVDSKMTIAEAVGKDVPPEIRQRQKLVTVTYYSFDDKVHQGQIVVDERLADDVQEVFRVALENKFPIGSVIPIADRKFQKEGQTNSDDLSMAANNTSAFNYRVKTGSSVLSQHAYGFAVDINPMQNPYIKGGTILPSNAVYDPAKPGTLTLDSPVVKTFKRLGWTWGGEWQSLKDYQHFEKGIK